MQRMVMFRQLTISIPNTVMKLLKDNSWYTFPVLVLISLFAWLDVMINLQQEIFTLENLLLCSPCFLEIV